MIYPIFALAALFGIVSIVFLGLTTHFYLHIPAATKVEVRRNLRKPH